MMDAKWNGHDDIRTNPRRSSKPRKDDTFPRILVELVKVHCVHSTHTAAVDLSSFLWKLESAFAISVALCFVSVVSDGPFLLLLTSPIVSFALFNLAKLAPGPSFLRTNCPFPRFLVCFVIACVKPSYARFDAATRVDAYTSHTLRQC